MLAVHRLYVATTGAVLVHRLPHTAGMGCRNRNRQGHRDKRACKQQHKQQPGGQAIHDWFRRPGFDSSLTKPLATSIGDTTPARKCSRVTVVSDEPTMDSITQVGLGFWASKTLLRAIEIEVFTELASHAENLNTLQGRLGLHPRSARDFLDALVALGLLQRVNGEYSNTPSTDKFLDKRQPSYVGGMLEMANPRSFLGQSHGGTPDRRSPERGQGRRAQLFCRALR
jgi:Dimerisation domain